MRSSESRKPGGLKVGEVAQATGLSIRTLHYYDEIGLLRPAAVTGKRHRLYAPSELVRLQQISALRQMGFSLDEIRRLLDQPSSVVLGVVEGHLAAVTDQLHALQGVRRSLELMAYLLRAGSPPNLETVLRSTKEAVMHEKFFTPEQLETLKARAQAMGPDAPGQGGATWKQLAREIRAEYDRQTPPEAPAMQALARRWRGLARDITGGDEGVRQGLSAMHQANPGVTFAFFGPDLDQDVLRYISRAVGALTD